MMAADVGAEDGEGKRGYDAELFLDGKKQRVVMRGGGNIRGWGRYQGMGKIPRVRVVLSMAADIGAEDRDWG